MKHMKHIHFFYYLGGAVFLSGANFLLQGKRPHVPLGDDELIEEKSVQS